MMVVVAAGVACGAGLILLRAWWTDTQLVPDGLWRPGDGQVTVPSARVVTSVAAGLAVWVVSGWPVVGLAVAAAVAFGPQLVSGEDHEAAIAKTEAIATWTEMLRDVMRGGGLGLRAALDTTAEVAPEAIREQVLEAMRRSGTVGTSEALGQLQAELDHPDADLVLSALRQAAGDHEVRDLGESLTRLANTARERAKMRSKIQTSRARVRTARTQVLVGAAVIMGGLMVANEGFFAAYRSAAGQVVLAVVLGLFVTGLVMMNRMSQIEMPEGFSARGREQG